MSSTPIGRRSGIVRFGVFEMDMGARELRKQGRNLRVQEQPFEFLATLIERAGAVVSREELRAKLWPADTFVDFDHGLNTAVNKLREALKDSASSPRYIETVARRGYRFVAEVQWESTDPAPPRTSDLPRPNRRTIRGLFTMIQIMYLVFYVEALLHWQGMERVPWVSSHAVAIVSVVLVTAAIGIPVRLYLLSAGLFDYSRLGEKFQRIFLGVFALDELWAVAPFLIFDWIGFGAALGATAALLYVPFAERTLVRMAYPQGKG